MTQAKADGGRTANECLKTARDLRDNSNGDCNAIAQAIYWEGKARAALSSSRSDQQ